MPSDLSSSKRRPRSQPSIATTISNSWRKLLLLLFVTICYSLIAIHNSYPPYNWILRYVHRNHVPKAAQYERYSKEHKYRPAASPIIKRVGKNGKIELHGQYHD